MLQSSLIDESVQNESVRSDSDIKSVDSEVVEEATSKFLGDYYGVVE
jgi:hypothetical protein